MTYCFTGFPLSGKSFLAKKLAADLGIERISTGDIARSLGMGLESSIQTDDLSLKYDEEITSRALEAAKEGKILDGFPRSMQQIEKLKNYSSKEGFDYKIVFVTENPLVVFDRINERARDSGRAEDKPEIVSGRLKASMAFFHRMKNECDVIIFASRFGYEGLRRALCL